MSSQNLQTAVHDEYLFVFCAGEFFSAAWAWFSVFCRVRGGENTEYMNNLPLRHRAVCHPATGGGRFQTRNSRAARRAATMVYASDVRSVTYLGTTEAIGSWIAAYDERGVPFW